MYRELALIVEEIGTYIEGRFDDLEYDATPAAGYKKKEPKASKRFDVEFEPSKPSAKKKIKASKRFDLDFDFDTDTKGTTSALKKKKKAIKPGAKKVQVTSKLDTKARSIWKKIQSRKHVSDPNLVVLKLRGTNDKTKKDLSYFLHSLGLNVPVQVGGVKTMAFVPAKTWKDLQKKLG